MGKEYKNIDDLFRSELGGSEISAPSHVKQGIDDALGFGKRKKRFLLLGLIGLFMISTAAILFNIPPDELMTANQELTHSSAQDTERAYEPSADRSNYPSVNTSSSHNDVQSTVSPTLQENLKPSELLNASTDSSLITRSTINVQRGNPISPKSDGSLANKLPTKKSKSETKVETDTINPKPIEPKNGDVLLKEAEPVSMINKVKDSVNQSSIDMSEATIETDTFEANDSESDATEQPEVEPLVDIEKPDEPEPKSWMIHLTGGPSFVRSAYTADSQMDKTTLNNGTEDQIGRQYNLDVIYGMKKGLSFGSGIGLSNFAEQYAYNTTKIKIDTIKNVEYIYDDTSEVIIDSIVTYTYEESLIAVQNDGLNRATYVHVPLHLGAQLIFNRLQVDIYSSIRFNFLTRSSGGYLFDNQYNEFGSKGSIYKPFYVDLMLATRVNYRIYKSFYASLNIQYRPVLGTTFNTTGFNKTFDYVHLGLGISMRF